MILNGGCACKAVRYRLNAEPYDTGWCHCRVCQHVSGSGAMVFTTVAASDYEIVEGKDRVGRFASTAFGTRTYCRDCGSPLTIHVAHQPTEIDITVGTLDDPGAVTPEFRLYVAEAPLWALPLDGLPRYNALRPATRGLPPGRTEG